MATQGWMSRVSSFVRRLPTVSGPPRASGTSSRPSQAPSGEVRPRPRDAAYVGDFAGTPTVAYEPNADGNPDPGEVVWAWVPYEDDPTQGKDRPALVIGRSGHLLLALPFTSKDHDRDAAQEARAGRFWFDVGAGGWDASGRPSEVRLDRIVQLEPGSVRREGAVLDRRRFEAMAVELVRVRGGRR